MLARSRTASRNIRLDLSCSQLSFPFTHFTQKFVLFFSKIQSKNEHDTPQNDLLR
jgi:hypothetical protein